MGRIVMNWALYQLPEAILMMYCGTRLLGLRPPPRRFWTATLLFAITVPLARLLPFPFGVHTLVLFCAYVILVAVLFRLSLQTSIIAAVLSNFLLALGDALVLGPILAVKRLTMADLLKTNAGFLIGGYLSASVLVLVALFLAVFQSRLITAPEALSGGSPAGRKDAGGNS